MSRRDVSPSGPHSGARAGSLTRSRAIRSCVAAACLWSLWRVLSGPGVVETARQTGSTGAGGAPPRAFSPADSGSRPRFLPRLWRAAACVLGGCIVALHAAAPVRADAPRLLTGLTAKAGPGGVVLAWRVDESRAGRIAGFACVYRTPGHLKTGVSGAVPCGPDSPAAARGRMVAGLPEYGEYLFEVVAETAAGSGIPWPQRALHVTVAVTRELAGPPGIAVTGAGPLVESCGPDDGEAAPPWRLDQVVSAEHLSHPPGVGWVAGGDSEVAPDWPEPPSFRELMGEARLARALDAPKGADASASVQAVMARAERTKALLRPGAGGGWELRLHSSYPFGGAYAYAPRHAVDGWADPGDSVLRPHLYYRTSCPPPEAPDATHDVALALADAAGDGRRLRHSGYGWWTVAPVGVLPERVVAAKAGLSFGAAADAPPEAGARWRGRLSGHLFFDGRRWALAGDVVLEAGLIDGVPALSGRIDNIALVPLDAESLRPGEGAPAGLPALVLEAGPAAQGRWSGAVRIAGGETGAAPDGLPGADAFRGDWQAAIHGPGAAEVAGRLRLWTPLADGADPAVAWPAQAVLVAGFGAARTKGDRP